MTEKMSPEESLLFDKVHELCILCAKGIAMIAGDTHTHPKLVAKLFMEVFQTVLDKMDEK